MKSGEDIRDEESGLFGSTNLIVHQGVTKIFHQTVEPLGILGVNEEIREIASCYY